MINAMKNKQTHSYICMHQDSFFLRTWCPSDLCDWYKDSL